MILFLSKYPQTEEEYRDGFFQRVVHIDSIFENRAKVYLVSSPYRYFKKTYLVNESEKRIIVKCNIFFHFALIMKLFSKSKVVYIHSMHNLLYLFMFLKIFDKKYILDLHGLVIDEFALEGDRKRAVIFNIIEKYIYSKIEFVIGVTHRMVNYYKEKYPNSNPKYIVYPILPNNLLNISPKEIGTKNRNEKIIFIYSGNLQPWQNIDLMLDTIKENNQNPHYFFQILTGQVDEMKKRFIEKNIHMQNVDIRGVKSEELATYYQRSHYGIVLRDDIPINNVACPTKLIEYMNYGIIPVVLSDEIGDFKNMGYEYLSVNRISEDLKQRKSFHNVEIVKKLYADSNKIKSLLKGLYE